MFSTTDTIVAIATPPGRGGIGVVRVSGPDARAIVQQLITHRDDLEPRHATFTKVRLKKDATRDDDRGSVSVVASGFSPTDAVIDHDRCRICYGDRPLSEFLTVSLEDLSCVWRDAVWLD